MTIKMAIETNYASLSRSQQKIARYIDEHYEDVVFLSIYELAEKLEISPASIVRFTRAIGFAGFTDMQKSMRSSVTVTKQQEEGGDAATGLAGIANECRETMDPMFRSIDMAQLNRVSETIIAAKDILIVGYMDSFGTAAELLHRLYGVRDRVHFTRLINDWDRILDLMTPDTLVIAVSFAPHYQYTYTCVTTAKERGCSVILLTDRAINPMSGCADEMLTFRLLRWGRGSKHEQLDVSPVSAYIHFLFCYLLEQYPAMMLDSNRYDEKFVDGYR